ncbi:MAG: hypothetical protein PHR44_07480 [Candidatus Omnitrophica bacterium]|nr:hypothetical protein [Candidatus Omnitrophota bacterium]
MENISHNILKELRDKKEMNLGQIIKILPKRYNDHRDAYPFVNLITGGYIDSIMSQNGKDIYNSKNRELAITLYTASFGKGEFEYIGQKIINRDDFNKQLFFCTTKADLYLEEERQRRSDRIWTLFIGIAIGIIVAIMSSAFTKKFGLN